MQKEGRPNEGESGRTWPPTNQREANEGTTVADILILDSQPPEL